MGNNSTKSNNKNGSSKPISLNRAAQLPSAAPNIEIMGNQGLRQHVETSRKTGVFHLSKSRLQEFPPDLAKLVNVLRSIDLSENKIKTLPENIGAFTNLKTLNLSHNHIEILPGQIGDLGKLETLSLQSNRLTTIPPSIQNLPKLRDIFLSENSITQFPLVLCQIKTLNVVDLSKNRLTEVPDGVGDLQVVELILNDNQIKKLSKDLAKCPNMKTIRLQNNQLRVENFPEEFLADSQVSLMSTEGNPIDPKKFQEAPGYDKYMERYTATKKKLT